MNEEEIATLAVYNHACNCTWGWPVTSHIDNLIATIRGLEAENARLRYALKVIAAGSPNRDAATVARQALENEAKLAHPVP